MAGAIPEAVLPQTGEGILPGHAIEALAGRGAIRTLRPFDADQVQPASLDLRLGETAWRVRASFLPGPTATVGEKISQLESWQAAQSTYPSTFRTDSLHSSGQPCAFWLRPP